MKDLRFNEEGLEGLKQEELMRFLESLVGYQIVKDQSVSILMFSRVDSEEHDTMETLKIYFQSWTEGENGMGTHHIWTSWQSKRKGCSQSGFKKEKWSKLITPELQDK